MKLSISPGNVKLGAIPSVSLPACVTCNPSAPCFRKCYARKLERIYPNVRKAYARNLETLNNTPVSYWAQIQDFTANCTHFRYHVSGDIPNRAYFAQMVHTAEIRPNTTF